MNLADKDDIKSLEELRNEREELEKAKIETVNEKQLLQSAIDQARNIQPSSISDDSAANRDRRKKIAVSESIDCLGCGSPIAVHAFMKHSVSCFAKIEQVDFSGPRPTESEDGSQIVHCDFYDPGTKTYCKKLKASCPKHSGFSSYRMRNKDTVLACGCPSADGTYCLVKRSSCQKHTDWENVKQASLLLAELGHMQTEKMLNFEEKVIAKRIMARHCPPVADTEATTTATMPATGTNS